MDKDIYKEIPTEQINKDTLEIDRKSIRETLDIIHREDYKAMKAVDDALDSISEIIEGVIRSLKSGGRLFYIGAGTSGRLGVLDASECPPTFGVDFDMVQGIIAGGDKALKKSIEGAEDSFGDGYKEVEVRGVTKNDVIIGIAACGVTPFVLGGLKCGKDNGLFTGFIVCNKNVKDIDVDVIVRLDVGPEPIAGSTRMKSGTATKVVLNMITTTAMIKLGKVYRNIMIDVKPWSNKLKKRAIRIVSQLAGTQPEESEKLLNESDWHVPIAAIMKIKGLSKEQAIKLFNENRENLL